MGSPCYYAYIGTNSVRGSQGIYTLRIDADAHTAEVVSSTHAYNSGGLALSPDEKFLYAASEGMTFDGFADGGVTAYQIDSTGKLHRLNGQRSHGQRTCCTAVDAKGQTVYACNFYQGTWSAYPLDADGALRPAKYVVSPPENSIWKALHCIAPIDDEHVGVISLAECALVIYRACDGTRVTSFSFPDQPFPRYFASDGNFIYAMMQSPDDIYVFRTFLKESGTIELIQKISLLDDAHPAPAATSTIRLTPDHSLLLAANRPSNTITLFSRQQNGILVREQMTALSGNGPRDFNISGDGALAVIAMQHSDEVYVHKIDYRQKTLVQLCGPIQIPSPAAVAVSKRCMQ